jgi:hypothetical protein
MPPIAAPFAPPMIAPMIAPPTAPPPIFAALSFPGASPTRTIGSVDIASRVPSASTIDWKRTPSRARSLNLPPRSTCVTTPSARAPAGMATLSPTLTSLVTRASTRSSTRARSLVIAVSFCRPITESAETTSSSYCFAGGSGARAGSVVACSSVRA